MLSSLKLFILKKLLYFFWIFSFALFSSQERDSVSLISEVVIDAYQKPTRFIASTKSAAIAQGNILKLNAPDRLLESLNFLPGTRMEERSPGSYRLAIRGSALRSPYGVRNVKVYLDEFIFSDATGNTYLNLLDPSLINKIELYKGPEGGDFGAVTGGTVLLKTSDSERKTLEMNAGSDGLFRYGAHYTRDFGQHSLQIFHSFHTADSYREQSALQRMNFFLKDKIIYKKDHQLNMMFLFSDLKYETPGGLTEAQMNDNRKQARPAAGAFPGASEQQAGIYNQTFMGGISHRFPLSESWSHFMVFQNTITSIKNPFITNFEKRKEENYAFRTHLNYEKILKNMLLQTRIGFEGGMNTTQIENFDNNKGVPGNLQNADKIFARSGFIFLSQKAEIGNRLFIDAAISLNGMEYQWKVPDAADGAVQFNNQWLPDFGITYLLSERFSIRGKIGKGNSAPVLEEFRSSTQEINTFLKPEYGWNKELGFRKQLGTSFYLEASFFDFRLKDAIVRRQNEAGQEFFVNSGSTAQQGIEITAETKKFKINSSFLNEIRFWASAAFYDFTFEEYRKNDEDYSGNKITGVPASTIQNLLSLKLANIMNVHFSHFYTSSFYLNDANSVASEPSLIGNLVFEFPLKLNNSILNFKVQMNNIYNTKYVLGYDINAFGGRFYNPAATRSFTAGMTIDF